LLKCERPRAGGGAETESGMAGQVGERE